MQYQAPGSPELAEKTKALIRSTEVGLDDKWSLDYGLTPKGHCELAGQVKALRERGVLVIGSGNMVLSLGKVDWRRLDETFAFDWATEANESMKRYIISGDHRPLVDFERQGSAFRLSIPSPKHYLPLLYSLALKEEGDSVELFNDKAVAGAITMTSVRIG